MKESGACPQCNCPLGGGQRVCPWCGPATWDSLNNENIKLARQRQVIEQCPAHLRDGLKKMLGVD